MKAKNGKSQLNGFLDGGSHLRGELHFEDTFRIDGRLTGKIESDGDLYVGERGEVHGEVRVGRLFVTGKVDAVVQAQRVESPLARQRVVTPAGDRRGDLRGLVRMVERARRRVPYRVMAS
jgi:hypothetical protein